MVVCKVLYSDCSPTKGVTTMLRQEFFVADIILGITTQFLGDESSIHLLWWVVVLKYLEVFCYFLTLGFFLQILAVDFINHNILAAVSGVQLSRIAGFVYQKISSSYYLLPGRLLEGLLIRKPMLCVEN